MRALWKRHGLGPPSQALRAKRLIAVRSLLVGARLASATGTNAPNITIAATKKPARRIRRRILAHQRRRKDTRDSSVDGAGQRAGAERTNRSSAAGEAGEPRAAFAGRRPVPGTSLATSASSCR